MWIPSTRKLPKKGGYFLQTNAVRQSNVTIVNVGKRCRKNHRRKKARRTWKTACVEGDIFQLCNKKPVTYYRAVGERTRAIVRIQNDTACTMTARLYMRHRCAPLCMSIALGQQVSANVPNLKKIVVSCNDTCAKSPVCRGKYTIVWHPKNDCRHHL
jgi:hypothetical protein